MEHRKPDDRHAWFAVRVRSKYEQTTALALSSRAIANIAPIAALTAALAFVLTPGLAQQQDTARKTEPQSYTLGPNDRILVRCLNADEIPATPIRVDSDGGITLPFVGRVAVAGLSISDAEKQLKAELAAYIREPQVSVTLSEARSQPVSVLGAINNPGVYQLEGRKRLAEVLSMAGGPRQDSGRVLTLTRRIATGRIPLAGARVDASGDFYVAQVDVKELTDGNAPAANILVAPNDMIAVAKSDVVYVVGEVRRPGGFPVGSGEQFTVVQALSLAEGLGSSASAKNARILRRSGNAGRVEIPVNVALILSGKSPDAALQANDILFIPDNPAKSVGLKTIDTAVRMATGVVIYRR